MTNHEGWNCPATPEKDHYSIGVPELVMIQCPPEQGQGKAFFALASARLAAGEELEARFTQAYQTAFPAIACAPQGTFEEIVASIVIKRQAGPR